MVFRTNSGNNSQGDCWRSIEPYSEWWESSMWQHKQNRNRMILGIGALAGVLALAGLVRAAPEPLDDLEKILLEKPSDQRTNHLHNQPQKLRITHFRKALSIK